MPIRKRFDHERMRGVAERATNRSPLPNAQCSYLQHDGRVASHTLVSFVWQLQVEGEQYRRAVSVTADNASKHGVPLPESWRTALACSSLNEIAAKFAAEQSAQLELELSCTILGQLAEHPGTACTPGTIVALKTHRGGRKDFVLCACIDGDRWLCHSGTLLNGSIDPGNPFDPSGLVEHDIVCSAFERRIPKRRITCATKLSATQLQEAIHEHADAWRLVVASALVKAEEIRAGPRPFDEGAVRAGFERDPFQWGTGLRQSYIYVLWVWRSNAQWHRAVVSARLDHVLDRTQLPLPTTIDDNDKVLHSQLVEAAARQMAPCKYLGLKIAAGLFEPDPSKWPSTCNNVPRHKSYARVHFEWVHVLCGIEKHRVEVLANNALSRGIPHCPLYKSAQSGLRFSIEFMDAVAEAKRAGMIFGGTAESKKAAIKYKGIVFDSERPDIVHQLPDGGADIQDEPVYWTLPCGRCVCWTLRELANARDDDLAPIDSDEAYRAVARELGYDVLGAAPDADITDFRDDPGILQQCRWTKIKWEVPEDETAPCWWIVNPCDAATKPPRLLSRSLVCLRLELNVKRCATSLKLRLEWERRLENNAKAVDVLQSNQHLWKHVAGPTPELLLQPSAAQLDDARKAAIAIQQMVDMHGGDHDGLDTFGTEVVAAVDMLAVLSWDAIQKERFWITPDGLFGELVRNAEHLLNRQAGEVERRRLRLAATCEEKDAGANEVVSGSKDIYGLCLDDFKAKSDRKPHRWRRAVQMATEIHLDEMRTLLELHYDEIHLERWKHHSKVPVRERQYSVFPAVALAHRKQLNQKLCLPKSVKTVLKEPADEADWRKLEELREVILAIAQGEEEVSLTEEEAAAVAESIEQTKSCFPDEVGGGCKLAPGCRVIVDVSQQGGPKPEKVRRKTAAVVRVRETVHVYTKPLWTERAPLLDKFGEAMAKNTIKVVAREWDLSVEDTFDHMMIVLWDALFLAQSEDWSRRGLANTPADETLELARWFLRDQKVGAKPLFDGICSFCGTLLHGDINKRSALSNKCTAPPANRDGKELVNDDGSVKTDAQPPFLLRYSPALFAKEAPAIFEHDPDTNRLSLKGSAPWLRPFHSRYTEDSNTWLYCTECKDRVFPTDNRAHSHVPFRDKASQCCTKPPRRSRGNPVMTQVNSSEPECEPDFELPLDEEDPVDEDAMVPDLLEPPEQRPTLEEYKEKWSRLLAQHSRCVPGTFSAENLVPAPDSRLFQDCPHVPFDKLQSEEAQARLSVCRPLSGLEAANVVGGVPTYAHNTGEVNYRRRAPLQLASTLGLRIHILVAVVVVGINNGKR